MTSAYKLVSDLSSSRPVKSGGGTEEWMRIGRRLEGFTRERESWRPSMFFWVGFKKPIGDFFTTGDSALIGVTNHVRRSTAIWSILEKSGELLPIEIEGYGEAFLFHVYSETNVLNMESTKWRMQAGKRLWIDTPVMDENRLPKWNAIVRMGDYSSYPILVEPELGVCFRSEYAKCRMTGLRFEPIEVR